MSSINKAKNDEKNFSIQKFIHTISVWNNSKAANLEFWNLLKGGYSIEKRRKTWDSHSRKWKEIFSHREPTDMRDWKTRNYQKRNEEIFFVVFLFHPTHNSRLWKYTKRNKIFILMPFFIRLSSDMLFGRKLKERNKKKFFFLVKILFFNFFFGSFFTYRRCALLCLILIQCEN